MEWHQQARAQFKSLFQNIFHNLYLIFLFYSEETNLVETHAYAILDAIEIKFDNGKT